MTPSFKVVSVEEGTVMSKQMYYYDGQLKRELLNVESEAINSNSKSLILNYYRQCVMRDLSVPRMLKVVNVLKCVARFIKKDFAQAARTDFEDYILSLKARNLSPETIDSNKKILKVFYKWFNGGESYPDCVKWFKGSSQRKRKLPEEMLNQDEVKSMLANCTSLRDKALISVLWESGARIGELGGLLIKHVSFDEYGCQITVDGKTGMRRIRLINSAPDVLGWLNKHPNANSPDAFIWININRNRLERMSHRYIYKMLSSTAQKAGVKKPVNPHNFRHSRATYMAQYLTEAQMKEYFGWTQNSDMAAQYVHLSGKQVDDAILRMHGLVKEDRLEDILKRASCPRCKEVNDVNNKFCTKCWLPLTQQAAIESEERKRKEEIGVVALMQILDKYRGEPERLAETLKLIQAGGDLK